jgi:hypothetical protein
MGVASLALTIRHLAKPAGVSAATAALVLSGKARGHVSSRGGRDAAARSAAGRGIVLLCALLLAHHPRRSAAAEPLAADSGRRAEVLAGLARDHAWFRLQKEALIEACRPRLEQSDEDLWCTMPAQCIPRVHSVNTIHGCPLCGDAINRGYGYYPWLSSPESPWKVQCPKCLERFPKNDFLAYYRSGLDERGDFAEARADKRLLSNLEHRTHGRDPGHRAQTFAYAFAEGATVTIPLSYHQERPR